MNANDYLLLEKWLGNAQGERVVQAISTELSMFQDILYGDKLFQVGSFGQNSWLNELHYVHKWMSTPYFSSSASVLPSLDTALPLDKASIDCVVVPFLQESMLKNNLFLSEIDRILKPMGHVVFFGFNPWSLWGGAIKCLKLFPEGKLPSAFAIKRAMQHLSYQQYAHTSFFYIPPVSSATWLKKLEFFNEIGKMLWPFPAGLYCLILGKYQPSPIFRPVEKKNSRYSKFTLPT